MMICMHLHTYRERERELMQMLMLLCATQDILSKTYS